MLRTLADALVPPQTGDMPAAKRTRSATDTATRAAKTPRAAKSATSTSVTAAPADPTPAPRRGRKAASSAESEAPSRPRGRRAGSVEGSDAVQAGPSPRQQVRAQTLERILTIAHDRLVTEGADALSLRSVARELGMVSSAVYRYVNSREDLLRMLAARAGDDLSATVEGTVRRGRGDASRRFTAIARTVRGWALEHPGDFTLLFGRTDATAVPSTAAGAPGPGTGALGLPAALLQLMVESGSGSGGGKASPSVRRELGALAGALGVEADAEATARALTAWTGLVGAVSVEVCGQLAGATANPGALFDVVVDRIAASTGLAG